MNLRYWGVMYLVPTDWDPEADDAGEAIVDASEYGRSHLAVAGELWALAGETGRAEQINAVIRRAYQRDPHFLDDRDAADLLSLLEGLETKLVGTVVDEHWEVPSDRLSELRQRTKLLPFEEGPDAVPKAGVATGISRVIAVRDILSRARDEHLHIVMD